MTKDQRRIAVNVLRSEARNSRVDAREFRKYHPKEAEVAAKVCRALFAAARELEKNHD